MAKKQECIDQLMKEMVAFANSMPAEKFKSLLDQAFHIQSGGRGPSLIVTSSQIPESCKKKSKGKKCNLWKRLIMVTFSLFMIVFLGSLLISSVAQKYYESDDIAYIAMRFCHAPLMKFILPCHIQENSGRILQSFTCTFRYWMRSLMASTIGLFERQLIDDDPVSQVCLLPNPLGAWNKEIQHHFDCLACSRAKEVLVVTPKRKEKPFSVAFLYSRPILFQGWGTEFSLSQVQDQVTGYKTLLELQRSQLDFYSSVEYITQVLDLSSADIIARLQNDSNVHLRWISHHYKISHIIKKFTERPPFVPANISSSIRKEILIDGKDAAPYMLTVERRRYTTWISYNQGSGTRILILTPPDSCLSSCKTLSLRLQPGDTFIFNNLVWNAYSVPYGNSSSVATLGMFTF